MSHANYLRLWIEGLQLDSACLKGLQHYMTPITIAGLHAAAIRHPNVVTNRCFLYRAVEWLTIATSEIVKPLKFFVRHTLIYKENADNAAGANDHTSRSKL